MAQACGPLIKVAAIVMFSTHKSLHPVCSVCLFLLLTQVLCIGRILLDWQLENAAQEFVV
jgi:hypothetical protein